MTRSVVSGSFTNFKGFLEICFKIYMRDTDKAFNWPTLASLAQKIWH